MTKLVIRRMMVMSSRTPAVEVEICRATRERRSSLVISFWQEWTGNSERFTQLS